MALRQMRPVREGAAMIAPFDRFLDAYPERDGGHDMDATRAAWERAIMCADPDAILAGAAAYRKATEGRPRRFTMSPKRWLNEGRWRDAGPVFGLPEMVWINCGSREWAAWTRFRGKTPPIDRRGGWRFPSRWPPVETAK